MPIPALNGGLSYVFLEAALRPAYASLPPAFPQKIWDAAVRLSHVQPLFTSTIDIVKTSGVALRAGNNLEFHLASKEEYSFPANAAAFNSAAEARTFHEALNRLLEKSKAQYALREGARLSDGTMLGFQL